jgi:hypothetical protein
MELIGTDLAFFVATTPGLGFRSPFYFTADYTPACAGPSAGRDNADVRIRPPVADRRCSFQAAWKLLCALRFLL